MKKQLTTYLKVVRTIYGEHAEDNPHEFTLNKRASVSSLKKAKGQLGVPLNQQLEALWSIANGSDGAPLFHDGQRLAGYALLSIQQAFEERSFFEQRASQYDGEIESDEPRDPRVGDGWFSDGWLPFAAIEGGALQLLIDHQPLGTGKPGQVIGYSHDPDEMVFIADSIADLLPISLKAIQDDPLEFLGIY